MARWARSPQDAALVLLAAARELGHDPDHLTARQALESWASAAQVPFRVTRGADADRLFYGFGVRDGVFELDLVRRFACRESGARCHVRCRVRVPLTPELAALGSHDESCEDPPTSPERHAWTTALGSRPEWAVLEHAVDVEVVVTADAE